MHNRIIQQETSTKMRCHSGYGSTFRTEMC